MSDGVRVVEHSSRRPVVATRLNGARRLAGGGRGWWCHQGSAASRHVAGGGFLRVFFHNWKNPTKWCDFFHKEQRYPSHLFLREFTENKCNRDFILLIFAGFIMFTAKPSIC